MNILIVSDTYFPSMGGAEVHVDELARHLRAAGHRVRLFVAEPKPMEGEADIVRVTWKRNFLEILSRLDGMVRGERPDIIAAHYSYRLATLAGIVARVRGIPMTVTLHGLGTLPEPGAKPLARIKAAVYRRASLAAATHVIATSQDMLDAVPWVSKKTTVVTNGADAVRFDPARLAADPEAAALRAGAAGRKVLLTVRRLNPKCGIQYLVEAMPAIVRRHPDVLWLMVGTGRLEGQIRERIRALGLERHVEMAGLVSNMDAPRWFSAADVVAFPSTAESTSISCIEAMLMAKPVVASAVGGLVELLGRDGSRGRLVKLVDWGHSNYEAPEVSAMPPERFAFLADAISDLLDDAGARARIGVEARAFALAHFTWDVVAAKTVGIYERCVRRPAL